MTAQLAPGWLPSRPPPPAKQRVSRVAAHLRGAAELCHIPPREERDAEGTDVASITNDAAAPAKGRGRGEGAAHNQGTINPCATGSHHFPVAAASEAL